MPVYTYKCKECNKTFEKVLDVQNYNKAVKCECGGETRKVITPSTIVIKGRGTYTVSFPEKK